MLTEYRQNKTAKYSTNFKARYKLYKEQKNLIQSMIYNGDKIPIKMLQEFNENYTIVKKLYHDKKMELYTKQLFKAR
jgi:hypothetical protein